MNYKKAVFWIIVFQVTAKQKKDWFKIANNSEKEPVFLHSVLIKGT